MSSRAAELTRLVPLIERANHEYYVLQEPALSDAEYDALLTRVKELVAAQPDLAPLAASVLERVGAGDQQRTPFVKVRHLVPMLSLRNAMSVEEMTEWATRAQDLTGQASLGAICGELKIDGLSMALTYEKGKLVRGATRGDGTEGEDVTLNVQQIAAIPQRLKLAPGESVPERFEVRGEVYLPRTSFAALNRALEQEDEAPYRSPRNAASGSLRVLDPARTKRAGLGFFAYGLVLPADAQLETLGISTHSAALDVLERWGFQTSPMRRTVNTLEEAEQLANDVVAARDSLDFDIDGVVLKLNSFAQQRTLGAVSREPRWAVARKWPVEAVETTLSEVRYQVGRTGRVTPVAVVEPVTIGGVTVTNATLHNADYITGLDLRIGDRVRLTRAGEVIPQILGVVPGHRSGQEVPIQFPGACPSCGHGLVRREGEADTFCESPTCPPQAVRRTLHAASRKALDIRGLGIDVAEQLHSSGTITDWTQLWELDEAALLKLEGFAQTKARNLLTSIAGRKNPPLVRFLIALGIQHLGETVSELLVARYGSLEAIQAASREELEQIEGIGPTIAAAVTAGWSSSNVRQQLARLAAAGVVAEAPAPSQAPTEAPVLAGLTFVITGTLSVSRDDLTARLKRLGGSVTGSVSKKTSYLIAGADVGAGKTDKAKELGVTVLSESALEQLIAERQPHPVASAGAVAAVSDGGAVIAAPRAETEAPRVKAADAQPVASVGQTDLFGEAAPQAPAKRRRR